MKQYILHRTFVSQDGSVYPQRTKPYYASELPPLALQSAFATLVDDPTVAIATTKTIEKNVVESVYNPVVDPNVVASHFQPKYHQAEVVQEPVAEIDLKHLNSPDHVVEAKVIVLGQSSVTDIADLPYVSRKTAEKLVQALADGQTFASYEELDKSFKLSFGRSWSDTGLLLSIQEVEEI